MLKTIAALLGALLVLLLAYGSIVEPRFLLDVQRHEAEVPGLPAAWEGRQVALLADLQVGMWWDNTGMIERTVDEVIEARPALALIAGDFVYKPDSAVVREAVSLVAPLAEAGLETIAVLGNHDYSLTGERDSVAVGMARYLETLLRGAGIRVLQNEAVPVIAGGAPLHVVGVGSEWADRSRPQDALAGLDPGQPRLVVMHNPVAFRDLPAGSAPLTLTGHTHGGQIRVPLTPSESWLDIARPREVVADGWAADSIGAAGNRLYVNRGLGFSIVPVRLFCRPELTLFTLRAAEGTLPEREPGG